MYQILSQSVSFCRLYINKENIFVFFFGSQCIYQTVQFLNFFIQSKTGVLLKVKTPSPGNFLQAVKILLVT